MEFPLNWVKKLKAFNNSQRKGVEPWEETWDRFNTCLWGYNLKQLGWVCPKTPQWWQTWVVLELLDFLEWGLIKVLELDISVMDFLPLSTFSNWGTKTVEVVEEERPEELTYPKPVLSELGFWELKTSSSLALDILSIWVASLTKLNLKIFYLLI